MPVDFLTADQQRSYGRYLGTFLSDPGGRRWSASHTRGGSKLQEDANTLLRRQLDGPLKLENSGPNPARVTFGQRGSDCHEASRHSASATASPLECSKGAHARCTTRPSARASSAAAASAGRTSAFTAPASLASSMTSRKAASETLDVALGHLSDRRVSWLPVIDSVDSRRVVGQLETQAIVRAYRSQLSKGVRDMRGLVADAEPQQPAPLTI